MSLPPVQTGFDYSECELLVLLLSFVYPRSRRTQCLAGWLAMHGGKNKELAVAGGPYTRYANAMPPRRSRRRKREKGPPSIRSLCLEWLSGRTATYTADRLLY